MVKFFRGNGVTELALDRKMSMLLVEVLHDASRFVEPVFEALSAVMLDDRFTVSNIGYSCMYCMANFNGVEDLQCFAGRALPLVQHRLVNDLCNFFLNPEAAPSIECFQVYSLDCLSLIRYCHHDLQSIVS